MSVSRCFLPHIRRTKYDTVLLICNENNLMDWVTECYNLFFRVDRVCESKHIRSLSRLRIPDRRSIAYRSLSDVPSKSYSIVICINGDWQTTDNLLDKVSDGGFVVLTCPFDNASDIIPYANTSYDVSEIMKEQVPSLIKYKVLQNVNGDLHHSFGKKWVYYMLLQRIQDENHTCNCGRT